MQTAHFRAVPAPYEMMRYHYIMLKHDDVRVRIARMKASQDGTVAFNRVWQDLVGIPTARLLKIVHCQNTWMGVSDGIKWARGRTMPSKNGLDHIRIHSILHSHYIL